MAEAFFCLRVDLTFLPWDEDPAASPEPVVLARLLGLGRTAGLRFHAFASPEALRAYPSYRESILGEGHHLDLLGTPFPDAPEPLPLWGPEGFAAWVEAARRTVRDRAARGRPVVLRVPAGTWGLEDRRLDALRGLVSLALAAGLPLRTLREAAEP